MTCADVEVAVHPADLVVRIVGRSVQKRGDELCLMVDDPTHVHRVKERPDVVVIEQSIVKI